MKEIGIRKVLGFSTASLYYNLSSGFLKLLFISVVIAWPGAYGVYKYLPGAHKYPIQIWEFLLATGHTFSGCTDHNQLPDSESSANQAGGKSA